VDKKGRGRGHIFSEGMVSSRRVSFCVKYDKDYKLCVTFMVSFADTDLRYDFQNHTTRRIDSRFYGQKMLLYIHVD
jgi:hypothetical protein